MIQTNEARKTRRARDLARQGAVRQSLTKFASRIPSAPSPPVIQVFKPTQAKNGDQVTEGAQTQAYENAEEHQLTLSCSTNAIVFENWRRSVRKYWQRHGTKRSAKKMVYCDPESSTGWGDYQGPIERHALGPTPLEKRYPS